jgi:hypothetical protein
VQVKGVRSASPFRQRQFERSFSFELSIFPPITETFRACRLTKVKILLSERRSAARREGRARHSVRAVVRETGRSSLQPAARRGLRALPKHRWQAISGPIDPHPIFRPFAQTFTDGIHQDVARLFLQLLMVAQSMVKKSRCHSTPNLPATNFFQFFTVVFIPGRHVCHDCARALRSRRRPCPPGKVDSFLAAHILS